MEQTASQIPTQPRPIQVDDQQRYQAPTDRSGQLLGNYRLVRLLETGGFAEVYLGEHIHLHTYAALKLLHTRLDSEALHEFCAEAQIVASLRHPHIISVFDFAVQDGVPCLVMDYAPNGTLRKRHPRGSRLYPMTVLTYLKQIASALYYAHCKALIHCDVKPENMLIGRANELLLSDFGIATIGQVEGLPPPHEIVGTISYMAPEQLHGAPQLASDQYALAIVAYEWLCGECPFRGSPAEVLAQHINAPPPSLRERVSGLPSALERVIFKALAKEPELRYPTVIHFVTAFETALLGRASPITATLLPGMLALTTPFLRSEVLEALHPEPPPSQRPSRRMVLFGLVGLGTATLAGGSLAWLMRQRSATTLPPTVSALDTLLRATALAAGETLLTYHGHTRPVSTVLWLAQREPLIVSASQDSSVQVWQANTGLTLINYSGHSAAVNAIASHPDGTRIASASSDTSVRVWSVDDGSDLYVYHGHAAAVLAVAWSPDGIRLASGSADSRVLVWNARNGGNLLSYTTQRQRIQAIAWSPDGARLASASADGSVHVWEASTGANLVVYQGHYGPVNSLAWSPDGARLASGGNDMSAQVWDAASGQLLARYQGSDRITAVSWSPDGLLLAAASADHAVRLWTDAGTQVPILTYREHEDVVNNVAWHPNGSYLASCSDDRTVRVWRSVAP